MNPPRLILPLGALIVAGFVAANPRRSSTLYEIVPETIDGGGGRVTSADYELVLSLTPGGNRSSSRHILGSGYAAQLSNSLNDLCQVYLDWIGSNFPDAEDPAALPAADDDDDGVPNVIEFAFNMNPTAADGTPLTPGSGLSGLPVIRPEIIAGQRRLTIEYIRRRNSCLEFAIEASDDLAAWAPIAATPNGAPVIINAGYERVKFDDIVTVTAAQSRFLRIRVALP